MSSITLEEKNRITDSNLHLFVARHVHDYWPCAYNSQRMIDFLESQLGRTLAQWPYPLHLEGIETAFFYLQSEHKLLSRPEEVEEADEAAEEEARKQQQVRDDYEARREAEQIQRDKNMPLKELGAKVSRQNADFRQQREQNLLPTRTPGLESRHVEQVQLGIAAQARVNVGLANPSLDTHSAEFARKCAVEVSRLRG
ncbi:MAG: hypothetical protein WCE26_19495 [Candidatus Acidiferrales bacterium]